ncbi:MAG: hypothetical protein WDW36_007111 [Sanguina aurantia]
MLPNFEAFKAVQRAIVAASKLSKATKQLAAARELAASASQLARPHPTEQPRRCVLVSVDVEWWEKDQARVLELGWSCWDNGGRLAVSRAAGTTAGRPAVSRWGGFVDRGDEIPGFDGTGSGQDRGHAAWHWIVEEWLYTHNGKYVPNHKHDFAFGASETGPLAHGVAQLTQDLAFAATVGRAPPPPPPPPPPQPPPPQSLTQGGTRTAAPQEPPRFLADGSFGRYGSEGGVRSTANGTASAHGTGSTSHGWVAAAGAAAGAAGCGGAGTGGGGTDDDGGAGTGGGDDDDGGGGGAAPAVLLVGHGMSQDLSMMGSLGVVLPAGVILADTQKLAWAAMGGVGAERGKAQMGLQALLKSLDMAPTKLHNAGNDALWTLRAALALLGA